MAVFSNRREHFRQYVRIAGKGNVEVAWTPLTDKMHLSCKTCDEQLTARESEDPQSIDGSIQDWVRMHAHAGYSPAGYNPLSLTKSWGPQIDKSALKSEAIAAQMKKYHAEIAEKTADSFLAKKIAELQAVTPEQKAEAEQYYEQQKADAQALINKAAEELLQKEAKNKAAAAEAWKQDMLHQLEIKKKLLQEELQRLETKVASHKPAALQTKEGRKFR
jgi:hypothetical protein